ncbi:hypothetical protein G7061_06770 [Erysipelothrix sp. HDW6B]|uniref:hypothetical protein n=1 Tax=Erysipelothrix TaxID=1647 RepID=UPI00135AC2FC|nr:MULTISPECIES: hypothetical protein [Erysipelothrix]QIK86331.1 hypothetical protein G7061_06770 [Erysipelothrix sp. HDW6B]
MEVGLFYIDDFFVKIFRFLDPYIIFLIKIFVLILIIYVLLGIKKYLKSNKTITK